MKIAAAFEADRNRGRRMPANSEHYTFQHKATINELGLRDRPVSSYAANEFRILAAGDSMIYGHGVANQDSVPGLMERKRLAPGNAYYLLLQRRGR